MTRDSFERLDAAVAAMRERAELVVAEGGLEGVKMFRDYEPGARIAARLEISTGGWLRSRDAGVDVMGDGRLVAYAGGVRRRELEPGPGQTVFDAVRDELDPGILSR